MKNQAFPKMILCDVDGTLTDGFRLISDSGGELKSFYVPDGTALLAVRKMGVLTGIVTADDRPLLRERARQLKFDIFESGVHDKLAKISEICRERGIELKDVGFIGDDINDYLVLKAIGFPACPSDAQNSIRKIQDIHITQARGGRGAVREWIESLFGEDQILEAFLGMPS
jgi:N-acylneuraminate cytidylyltransferase